MAGLVRVVVVGVGSSLAEPWLCMTEDMGLVLEICWLPIDCLTADASAGGRISQ